MFTESPKRLSNGGYLHRLREPTPGSSVQYKAPPCRVTDWAAMAEHYVRAVKPEALRTFARSMGLLVSALRDLQTGWDGESWTTPMRNGKLKIVGIQRRFADGMKRCVPGSHGRLFVPLSLNNENPLYLAEGASDTAALRGLDLPVVGLFNAGGNAEQVIELLAGRRAVLIADNDARSKPGQIGGRERAATFCRRLRAAGVHLRIVHPPAPYKDARELLTRAGWGREEFLAYADGMGKARSARRVTSSWTR